MTLLASFQVLLRRYTGQSDLLVGTPVANRQWKELENLIGFFVNTLVIRSDLAGDPPFRQVLSGVRETALQAYAHQDLPFEQVLSALEVERSLSYAPLFQVFFAFLNLPDTDLALEGLTVDLLEVTQTTSKFDLSVEVHETARELWANIEYNTDLFDADTIQRLLGHWQTLLESIVARPEQRISMLPLLPIVEREQILFTWNKSGMSLPQPRSLPQLFEQQVERTPNALALISAEEQLTYQDLNNRANQLAVHLRRLGVGPEILVGVCLPRSAALMIGLLAIWKAGGGYVPLDPVYPQQRLTYMLKDSGLSIVLTNSDLQEKFSLENAPLLLCLDKAWEHIQDESPANLMHRIQPEHCAYVIYTSGSTGLAKGVVIQHGNAAAFINWATRCFSRDELAGVLASTSICFDLSIFELFAPICSGGTTLLVEDLFHSACLACC